MATTLEKQTVKGHISDICASIPASDVSAFADELLQAGLICEAGHKEAIELTGSASRNKVSKLMTEVMTRVAGSQDKFAKFVSILESRNKELAKTLRSAYQRELTSCFETAETDPSPAPKRRKEQDSFADQYVAQFRQVYRAPPPTWDPLPQCKHIRLAMIKEKGKRRDGADDKITASRVKGEVDDILEVKVPVDMDAIFDDGIFDESRQVILVEAGPGMGKTSLGYYYSQKWKKDELKAFDAVAFVRLRDLCVRGDDTQPLQHILSSLLFLASGNRIEVSEEMCHHLVTNLKFLLVLDGWDELPGSFNKSEFLCALLASVSSQAVILITSRPESSLHLHGQANRVSIIGFTGNDIDEYFRKAFQSELVSPKDVHSACSKLSDHFRRYLVIKSCCYVPLNAAILAYVYLSGGQSLPITRFELFCDLVLCCIKCELESHKPVRVLNDVSSFEDLPPDLSKQLHNLCVLAFEGVKNNKIVFSQKELPSFKLPKDLPTLGLLESVEGYGSVGIRQITYNFIHLAVQELLAAYYISKIESDKHAEVFKSLLNESRSSAVLHFYSAFSQLTNEGVRNIITNYGFFSPREDNQKSIILSNVRVSILNCFFEAQLCDESFYRQFLDNPIIQLVRQDVRITLSPLDCISLFYFLSSTHAVTRGNVRVDLSNCHIDSHSEDVLLGEFPEHGQPSTTRVLDCVTEWITHDITDTGLAYIGTALTTNSALKVLSLGTRLLDPNATDEGLMPFLKGLQKNKSLESLSICWSSTHPDQSLKKMRESVAKSSLKQLYMKIVSPQLPTEEAIKDWAQSVQVGATDLIQSSECHQLQHLKLNITCACTVNIVDQVMNSVVYSIDAQVSTVNIVDQVMNSVVDSLDAKIKLVNSKRQAKGFLPITLAGGQSHPVFPVSSMHSFFKTFSILSTT